MQVPTERPAEIKKAVKFRIGDIDGEINPGPGVPKAQQPQGPKGLTWECDICRTNNELAAAVCVDCNNSRPQLPAIEEEKEAKPPLTELKLPNSRVQVEPLPLFHSEKDGALHLSYPVLSSLKQNFKTDKNIVIVVAAGFLGTGKSTWLSSALSIFNTQERTYAPFEIGHGSQTTTLGLWVFPQPLFIEESPNTQIMLMDMEGLFGLKDEDSKVTDMVTLKLYTVGLILSSVFTIHTHTKVDSPSLKMLEVAFDILQRMSNFLKISIPELYLMIKDCETENHGHYGKGLMALIAKHYAHKTELISRLKPFPRPPPPSSFLAKKSMPPDFKELYGSQYYNQILAFFRESVRYPKQMAGLHRPMNIYEVVDLMNDIAQTINSTNFDHSFQINVQKNVIETFLPFKTQLLEDFNNEAMDLAQEIEITKSPQDIQALLDKLAEEKLAIFEARVKEGTAYSIGDPPLRSVYCELQTGLRNRYAKRIFFQRKMLAEQNTQMRADFQKMIDAITEASQKHFDTIKRIQDIRDQEAAVVKKNFEEFERNNSPHTQKYANGDCYTGDFRNGKWNGVGKLRCGNGDFYEGTFQDGEFFGFGAMSWNNGTSYKGEWRENFRWGKGAQTYPSGDVYEGDWIRDVRSGHGRMVFEKGGFYEGGWREDSMHGSGRFTKDELIENGEWDRGIQISSHLRPIFPGDKSKKPILPMSILVLGGTGAGKTSFINLCYIISQNKKPYEFTEVLIKTKYYNGTFQEGDPEHQSQSQTQKASYYSMTIEGSNAMFDLTFLDTPGFGDPEGEQKDTMIEQRIFDTILKAKNFSAILLMMNGTNARLTEHTKYIGIRLINILPDELKNNVYALLTNCRSSNLDIQELTFRIRSNQIFCIDNTLFSQELTPSIKDDVLKNYHLNHSQIIRMLEGMSNLSEIDVKGFKLISEGRQNIRFEISIISNLMQDATRYKENIQDALKKIHDEGANWLTLKAQLDTIQKVKRQRETKSHNTVCLRHEANCHISCGLQETTTQGSGIFLNCAAFSNGVCSSCTCTHQLYHVHIKRLYEEASDHLLNSSIESRMNQAKSVEEQTKLLNAELKERLSEVDAKINQCMTRLEAQFISLKKTCSGFNYRDEMNLAKRMIELQIKDLYKKRETAPEPEQSEIDRLVVAKTFTIDLYEEILKKMVESEKIN